MYELIKVAENTYYMDCPTKVGFFYTGNNEVVLIDSGSDKDSAKKVKKILDENGWKLKTIFNTHYHADHTGGNAYLQGLTGCRIFAPNTEYLISSNPLLEPDMLYGGFSMKELHNKFLTAKPSNIERLTEDVLPDGLEVLPLPGHSYDMVGFKTADNVIFLADSVSSLSTLQKYKIGFLYDVDTYIKTLEKIQTLNAGLFIPSHAEQTKDIKGLARINIEKTLEVAEKIKTLLKEPKTFEELLSVLFTEYNLTMNLQQRMLVGSTVKSYLSYLKDKGDLNFEFKDNLMIWYAI